MNGTNGRWLRGMLMALGVALALTSVGCLSQTSDSEADDDENVGVADQGIEPGAAQNPSNGGLPGPAGEAEAGGENNDPQPQPWKSNVIKKAIDSNPDPGPDPDPSTPSMSSPSSNGHHDA